MTSTSTGLHLFTVLCDCGNAIAQRRECYDPGSDAWLALTELLQGLDALVDMLVLSAPLEEPDHA